VRRAWLAPVLFAAACSFDLPDVVAESHDAAAGGGSGGQANDGSAGDAPSDVAGDTQTDASPDVVTDAPDAAPPDFCQSQPTKVILCSEFSYPGLEWIQGSSSGGSAYQFVDTRYVSPPQSAMFTSPGTGAAFFRNSYSSQAGSVRLEFQLWVDQLGASGASLVVASVTFAGGYALSLQLFADGTLHLRESVPADAGTASDVVVASPSVGAWHAVALNADFTTESATVSVDGTSSGPKPTAGLVAPVTLSDVSVGATFPSGSGSWVIYLDNLIFDAL
jgi:hypothetical protein